jgi:predicted NAD/FAD-binding protein
MLDTPSDDECRLLGAFRYSQNRAYLHRDAALMPRRRAAWASWNYLGGEDSLAVTYWMNRLQPLPTRQQLFVTLNPPREPLQVEREFSYEHPLFDLAALDAQRQLVQLQGTQRTWFCGSYFGYGFHEDALEAGLWVGEALGGIARPWSLERPSPRTGLPLTPAVRA